MATKIDRICNNKKADPSTNSEQNIKMGKREHNPSINFQEVKEKVEESFKKI